MMACDGERFVLEARLLTTPTTEQELAKRFYIGWKMHNLVVKYAKNQLQQMYESKAYRETLETYRKAKGDDKKPVGEKLKAIVASYSVSEFDLQHFLVLQQNKYSKFIDSNSAQKIATNVSKGVRDVLYSKGKTLHFKKLNNFDTIEGKSNSTGIMLKTDNGCYMKWGKLIVPIKIRDKDYLLQHALEGNGVCYCRVVRKSFKSGFKYYLQIVFKGERPSKITDVIKSPKKRVGIDIGTSTVAATNGKKCILKQLAPGIEKYNAEIEKLSTKLEHQRRCNNPDNFNEDGTIKRGKKLKWNYSRNYYRTLWQLKNAYRRRAVCLRQSHNVLAKEILKMGDTDFVETMNFKALAKKAKETEISEKTGKYKSKKRFGKSIESRAPGLFVSILKTKLSYQHKELNKVNTQKFKASQYNHITDSYCKKDLSDRGNDIDGKWVQRDLYSAFLLMNSNEDLTQTNRESCLATYPNFKKAHDKCIKEIKKAGLHTPSSFGIA